MLKKVIGGLFMLAIMGCFAAVVAKDVFVYILCFVMLVGAVLFALLVLVMKPIWKLLPENFKKTHEKSRNRLNVIIFFSIGLFFFVRVVVNQRFLLDYASGFVGLLSNTMIFVFAVFVGWSLIRRSKIKNMVAGSSVFVLLVGLLLFVNSNTLKSGEIGDVNSFEKLKSLGYVDWVPIEKKTDERKRGVVLYEAESAYNGINIYAPEHLPEAYLIDMQGNILHKWAKQVKGVGNWRHVEICENGDLLAVATDKMLILLDWDSNVTWKKKIRAHHDVSIDESNNLYVLGREDTMVFWHGIPVPILNDYILVLSPGGETIKKIHIYDFVKGKIPLRRVVKIYCWILMPNNLKSIFFGKLKMNYVCGGHCGVFDVMHTNSIEIMDRDIDGFCKKGDWLISIHALNLVGILDVGKEEFTWSWGPGELDGQHHPTLLKNGNVLIFDNGYNNRDFTRIVELNPLTRKIEWEYKSDPPQKFYSNSRGSCQRLPNGNTLIAESDKGCVFEVTKEGRVVWEFYNPDVKMEEQKRGAIYRMMRIANPERYQHLGKFE